MLILDGGNSNDCLLKKVSRSQREYMDGRGYRFSRSLKRNRRWNTYVGGIFQPTSIFTMPIRQTRNGAQGRRRCLSDIRWQQINILYKIWRHRYLSSQTMSFSTKTHYFSNKLPHMSSCYGLRRRREYILSQSDGSLPAPWQEAEKRFKMK